MNKLANIEDSITNYIEEGGPGKLASCQRAIKGIEQEQERVQSEVTDLTKEANELKNLMADGEKTKRSMSDNVRYRKLLRKLKDWR
jgi:DNA repair protein RAD50